MSENQNEHDGQEVLRSDHGGTLRYSATPDQASQKQVVSELVKLSASSPDRNPEAQSAAAPRPANTGGPAAPQPPKRPEGR